MRILYYLSWTKAWMTNYSPVEALSDASSDDGNDFEKGCDDGTPSMEATRNKRSASKRQFAVTSIAYLLGLLTFLMLDRVVFYSDVPYETRNSPARFAAQYEPRVAYPLKEQEMIGWRGLPTQEVDDLWTEISNYKTMVLSREELELAGENLTGAAELKTGGFLSLLGVFHELHCIDEIRKFIYKGFYYPNATDDDIMSKLVHIDHCIDILRESVSCTGDLTVFHYEIRQETSEARVLTNTERKCLKLEPMIQWVRSTQQGHETAIGVPVVL